MDKAAELLEDTQLFRDFKFDIDELREVAIRSNYDQKVTYLSGCMVEVMDALKAHSGELLKLRQEIRTLKSKK